MPPLVIARRFEALRLAPRRIPALFLRRGQTLALPMLVALLLSACGGGGGDGPTPPPSLSGITASPTTVTITGVGGTASLTAATQPAGVSASITWSSDNTAIAAVAGSGTTATVTGVSGGTAQITARASTFSATVIVTVTPIVRAVTLPADTLRLMVGDTAAQAATLNADAGEIATLAWSTADPAIATVNASGQVTAVAAGVTTVTASVTAFPGVTASRPVRVSPPAVQVMVAPSSASLLTGDTLTLAATVAAPSGTSTVVNWTSSANAVATVNGSGRVTAIAAGTAQITATSVANPAASASATVTVRAPTVQSVVLQPDSIALLTGASQTLQAVVTADPGVSTALTWSSSDNAIATVSGAGVVTAVSPGGPIVITATSTAAPARSGSTRVVVESPPMNGTFVVQRVGVGGSAGGHGGVLLAHLADNEVLAGVGFQGGGGGTFQNGVFRLSGGVSSDISASCCREAGLPRAIAGFSVDDALVSFSGDAVFSGGPPSVQRRTAGGYVDTNWPVPAGLNASFIAHLLAYGTGDYLALTSRAAVHRYASGTWSTLGAIDFGTGQYVGEAVMIDDNEVVAYGCSPSDMPVLYHWNAGVTSLLAPPPTSCESVFNTTLAGRSIMSLTATDASATYRFDGTMWQMLAPSVVGGDTITNVVSCGGTHYGTSRNGRIFELSGAQFSSIGEPGVVTALQEFSSRAVIDCAPNGPLRVLSGSARLMRRTTGGWVEENFAPTLTSVHASSPTNAYAVGNGVVYRWNGSTWSRTRVFTEPDLRMTSVLTRGANDMLAVGEIRRSGGTTATSGMVRHDGSSWVHTPLPQYSDIDQLVPIGPNASLARVFTVGFLRTVARLDGDNWTTLSVGLPNVSLLAASGPTNALALSSTGAAARYDGSSWQTIASIPGPFSAFSGALYTTSPTFAMAGNCVSSGTSRIVRWNGTAWSDTPLAGLPALTCVRSNYATSSTDVYALESGAGQADSRALLHWDGTTWEEVNVANIEDARAGSAVPGLSLLTGFRAFTAVSRPPIAARRQ